MIKKNTIRNLIVIIFFFFVSFGISQTAFATNNVTFGHACSSNSDCISRDCEDGFCDCSNADSCARSFQGSADDWQCVDESEDPLHRGLEFCVKSSFGDSYPDHSTDEVKYPLEELLPMGAICYNEFNCKSGDCDESNVSSGSDPWNRDKISYCDCSDANSCALGYGGEEQDWECLGETEANRDINYCLNIRESTARDPFQNSSGYYSDEDTGETPANPTLSDAVLNPTAVSAMTQSDLNTLLQKPQPRIKIPGLNFSGASVKEFEVTDDDGTKWLVIPYLGEYLAAIYKYGIVVITILSVIALIDGGLTYIMSNGKTQNQESGIKRIKGAVMGLILAVGSYVILYTINPELTQFRNLKVLYINGVNLDSAVIENFDPSLYADLGTAKPITDTTYDQLFKSFANCIGADWRVLKVFAFKESRMNPSVINKYGFTGLFQTKSEYCVSALKAKNPKWSALCGNLTNVNVNTAVGAMMLKKGLDKIKKCPNLSMIDAGALIYLNHNSGGGSVNYILDHNGCSGGDAIKRGIIDFWNTYKSGKYAGNGMGEKRGPYAYSVSELIQAQGVTDLFDTSQNGDAACPLNSDPVAAPIVSSAPAAVGDSGRFVVISDTNSSYGSTGQSKQVGTAIQTIIGIKPAFVIHNGDMIAGGKEKNYDEAKMNKMWGGYQSEISDPLSQAGIALFPVAGNHDLTKTADTYGSFWLQRKPQTEVTSGYPKNYTFEYNGWHFVMLYAPNGDRAEASWLESDLNANKNKNILVFSHYPVIPLCSQGSAYNTGLLTQTFSVLQKFSRDNPGKLKGYFHGHSHIFHDGVESGVRVISTGHLSTDGCTAANANDSTGPSFIVVDLNSSGVVTVSRSST